MSLTDSYGTYTPSPPLPPVPSFPCVENCQCTPSHRLCERHRSVLFVKLIEEGKWGKEESGSGLPSQIEIPYGKWENWAWYADRIAEATGLQNDESSKQFRIIFAGCERSPSDQRHSGLQVQSQIHCIIKAKITTTSS